MFEGQKEEMEAAVKSSDVKLSELKIDVGKTNTIIEAGKTRIIQRQLLTLRSITAKINRM